MNDARINKGRTLQTSALKKKKDKKQGNTLSAFPDEIMHLDYIMEKLRKAIELADDSVKHMEKEYMDTKRYMVQYRGEIDPHEMFQNQLALKQIDNQGAFSVKVRNKLIMLKDSPYFARIDFQEEALDSPVSVYIGRFVFNIDEELLISDWRSPIASMFYNCEIGAAGYDAPVGRINGKLTRKRQFKITGGEMDYVLESSVNILDDVLQRELSHTSDEKMKSIIATIQKEQNQIIRNEKAHTLLIQGVAGSGKTSIALHRVAYMLYRFKDRLSANNVIILSPNKVFGDYISQVLPELGEEPICGMSFFDIAELHLDGALNFEPDKDPFEEKDPKWTERVRFKSTLGFLKQMDEFLSQLPDTIFEPSDYHFGSFTAESKWIKERFAAYYNIPIKKRLQEVAHDILEQYVNQNFMGDPMPKMGNIIKNLSAMLKVKNILTLYKNFYKQMNIADKFVMHNRKTLEWADVYPFMYFQAAFSGLQENRTIRHLVIDEMQDYTPVQFAVINILFKCSKTMLGDFGQLINPNQLSKLDDLRKLYEGAEFVELKKSYRSTCEIIAFANRIQKGLEVEAVERHGDAPMLVHCRDKKEERKIVRELISEFKSGDFVTMGIIMKTSSEAKELYDELSQSFKMHLIKPESEVFEKGISIASIQMSKGLEFDEVIIPSANSNTYSNIHDRNLLYVASTRAMHRLVLTYTGEISPLIHQ